MEGCGNGRMEQGRRGGVGVKGWRCAEMEGWGPAGMEGCRDGRCRDEGMEGWGDEGMEGWGML